MNQLRKTRVHKDLTQFQVAVVSGVSQSRLSLAENGYVQLREDEKKKLSKVLKTPAEELFPAPKKGKTLLTEAER